MKRINDQIIYTNKAKCRDCYRCIRSCKVKSIKMKGSQAFVDDLRCIKCGICIKECPRNAKNYLYDIDKFDSFLNDNEKIAVSIAPSFAGVFKNWQLNRISSLLRSLGCIYIGETAIGAHYSAHYSAQYIKDHPNQSHISGSCPVVVNYIEKYMPQAVDMIIPVVSPMIAHAKILKERYGNDIKVVFIGPCVAKKDEAARKEYQGLVDAVLTFEEFEEFLEEKELELKNFEPSDFDELPAGDTRLYPILGGMLKSADISDNITSENIISLSGADNIKSSADLILNSDSNFIIEPLFCSNGCINGPGINSEKNYYERRNSVINYNKENESNENPEEYDKKQFLTSYYRNVAIESKIHTETKIRQILESTGKLTEEDQLNCGACGYLSCRDKAIAVLDGMAETEMCIPYMRRIAEQRSDKIMETTPNGIIILNDVFEIIQINPAFKKMFNCSDNLLGKPFSYLLDPENFLRLSAIEEDQLEITVEYKAYNLICHEILYKLEQENQFVGIFVNVTNHARSSETLNKMRSKTVEQAKLLMSHQINLAQNIAKMLGESTAEGEALVDNLIKLNNEQLNL